MRKKLKFEETCGDENSIQPIYEFPLSKYSAEEIIKILLTADKVCVTKPASVCNSAIYVCGCTKVKNRDNIKKDEFGICNYSRSHPQPYKVHQDEGSLIVEKCCPGATGANVVLLRHLHCTHPSNAKFKRHILFFNRYVMCKHWAKGSINNMHHSNKIFKCHLFLLPSGP